MEIILSAIIFSLLVMLVLQAIAHGKERKDLYNRIMASDLRDYSVNQKRDPPKSRNFIKKGLEKGYDFLEGGGEQ